MKQDERENKKYYELSLSKIAKNHNFFRKMTEKNLKRMFIFFFLQELHDDSRFVGGAAQNTKIKKSVSQKRRALEIFREKRDRIREE